MQSGPIVIGADGNLVKFSQSIIPEQLGLVCVELKTIGVHPARDVFNAYAKLKQFFCRTLCYFIIQIEINLYVYRVIFCIETELKDIQAFATANYNAYIDAPVQDVLYCPKCSRIMILSGQGRQ
jgi:hypothetical protein